MRSPLWDSGLQPERTALAWQRTSLAVAVSALAIVRLAVHEDSIAGLVVGSLVLVSSGFSIHRVRAGYHRMISEALGTPVPRTPVGGGAATACSIALLGVATLLVLA